MTVSGYDNGMTPAEFRRRNPDAFFLACDEPAALGAYLVRLGVLGDDERVLSATPAGEGNMNLTVRVATSLRSLIVKQSRPWVERYPSIAAPRDRVLGEARFYLLTSPHEEVAVRTPRLIEIDPVARVMVLEDLGESSDCSGLYGDERLTPADARTLAEWLGALHRLDFNEKSAASLTGREMRALNHEHLFRLPLAPDNGLDLDAITPGLAEAAGELAADSGYVERVGQLGELYLIDGPTLLHGDYFPGSWLRSADGLRVIDPEFAFFGPAEFDVGVLLAHLYLADQPEAVHSAVIEGYGEHDPFYWRLAMRFAGVEMMRRLIGVAQLPLRADLALKRRLLRFSQRLVTSSEPLTCEGVLAGASLLRRIESEPDEGARSA